MQARPGALVAAVATMLTCPQLLREEVWGHEYEEKLLAVADVWALAVILYFFLFGRWPFDKSLICHWPMTPAEEWNDDAAISYAAAPGAFPARTQLRRAAPQRARSHTHAITPPPIACAVIGQSCVSHGRARFSPTPLASFLMNVHTRSRVIRVSWRTLPVQSDTCVASSCAWRVRGPQLLQLHCGRTLAPRQVGADRCLCTPRIPRMHNRSCQPEHLLRPPTRLL